MIPSAPSRYGGCPRCRLAGRLCTAMLLLGVAVAVQLRLREPDPVRTPPPTLMLFNIDAAPPASPPVPVQPKQAKQVTPPHPASPPVRPVVATSLDAPVPVVRTVVPVAAAIERAPPTPPSPQPAPPPAAPPVPDAPPAPAAAGSSATSWEGQVLARLAKVKAYPEAARRAGIEGIVLVRFTVVRDGALLGVALAASSGSPMLDHAATAAVTRAAPFPPIPPARPDRVELTVPVSFSLSSVRS